MYKDKRIVAIIPARGGSKGIKGKNIIDLAGKPLISYTIDASIKSEYIDRTVISTDSEEIAGVSEKYGAEVPFMRPAELASDHARTVDAIIHAIGELKNAGDAPDVIVLLQPTEPLRTAEDIDGAIETFFEKGMRGLVSVSPVNDSPILMRTISEDGELSSLFGGNSTCRRQDMPDYYRVNGCIYINSADEITKDLSFNDNPVGFVMEQSHSVDIDEMKDLAVAEYYIENESKD